MDTNWEAVWNRCSFVKAIENPKQVIVHEELLSMDKEVSFYFYSFYSSFLCNFLYWMNKKKIKFLLKDIIPLTYQKEIPLKFTISGKSVYLYITNLFLQWFSEIYWIWH